VAYSRPLPEDRAGSEAVHAGRVDGAFLDRRLTDLDAEYYLCGPVAFMAEIRAALEARGVPSDQIHGETFGAGAEPIGRTLLIGERQQ
jgi:ferredoxin-NADP reductase